MFATPMSRQLDVRDSEMTGAAGLRTKGPRSDDFSASNNSDCRDVSTAL